MMMNKLKMNNLNKDKMKILEILKSIKVIKIMILYLMKIFIWIITHKLHKTVLIKVVMPLQRILKIN